VFLSADTTNAQKLVDGGFAEGDAVVFASNELTIITPTDNPAGLTTPFDLGTSGVRVVAAGDEVPITKYATQLVENLAAAPNAPADFADGCSVWRLSCRLPHSEKAQSPVPFPDRTIRRIVPRGHRDAVSLKVDAPSVVEGPIRSGQRLGKVEVRQGGKVVATAALIAQAAVPAANTAQRTKAAAGSPWLIIGVALAVLVATVLLMARRRARISRRRRPRQTSAA